MKVSLEKHVKVQLRALKETDKHLKEIINLRIKCMEETVELRSKLSEIAINKAENSILERMEVSNNKFALLKEQAAEFPTKNDLNSINDKLTLHSKFIYGVMGAFLLIELYLRYFR